MNRQETTASAEEQFLQEFDGDAAEAIKHLELKLKNSQKRSNFQKAQIVSPDAPIVIDVDAVSMRYKVGKQRISALDSLSVQICESEFVAITGPSGSGKSTLLQLIGALDKPSHGTIRIDGQTTKSLSDRRLSMFRNKTIGFVFQFFYLQPFLNLERNLEVPGMFARTKKKERKERVRELAERVGLGDRLKHLPNELSGGQMQRAAIARALLNKPRILLADEPTGNLDRENAFAIMDLFDEIRSAYGTTVVVVTHDMELAERADRIIAMQDGKVV